MLYCAHTIFYYKRFGKKQKTFLVHENVYLIDAEDPDQATESALKIAKEIESAHEDSSIEGNGKKYRYLFSGLRKLIEVQASPYPVSQSGLAGLELTYSIFLVNGLKKVHALGRGKRVKILYTE